MGINFNLTGVKTTIKMINVIHMIKMYKNTWVKLSVEHLINLTMEQNLDLCEIWPTTKSLEETIFYWFGLYKWASIMD